MATRESLRPLLQKLGRAAYEKYETELRQSLGRDTIDFTPWPSISECRRERWESVALAVLKGLDHPLVIGLD